MRGTHLNAETSTDFTSNQTHLLKTLPPTEPQSQAEKRIAFLLKKHFEDDPDFHRLILELAEYDPTPKKKYLAWLVKHWTGLWNPNKAELERVAACLDIHQKGSKYFSPLTWTGLVLEDAGYQADVFRFSPKTISIMKGKIEEIIRADEENKQIRKGNLVVTAGAEIAYQDDRWTLLRIRTKEALKRLGQGTSWCVRHGNNLGYPFPFDFLINSEGERFLANRNDVRNRWDTLPPQSTQIEIKRVRSLASDGFDGAASLVDESINLKERLEEIHEKQILKYPELAIRYSEKVLGGGWPEFEKSVRVSSLTAHFATEYAIHCLRKPWPRFENKIRRSVEPLASYRQAFPGSIPKNQEEIYRDKLAQWRQRSGFRQPKLRWSVQWQAENRVRNVDFEVRLLRYSEASIKRFAKIIVSLATSDVASEYRTKLLSYFEDSPNDATKAINQKLAPLICDQIYERVKELEPLIAGNGKLAYAYAMGIGQQFAAGEQAMKHDAELWRNYRECFYHSDQKSKVAARDFPSRIYLPATTRKAWM